MVNKMQNTWELAVDEDDKRAWINMRSSRETRSRVTWCARQNDIRCGDYNFRTNIDLISVQENHQPNDTWQTNFNVFRN